MNATTELALLNRDTGKAIAAVDIVTGADVIEVLRGAGYRDRGNEFRIAAVVVLFIRGVNRWAYAPARVECDPDRVLEVGAGARGR